MDEKTALEILGLDGKPSREEAKRAFHRLAKIHHPDHFARDNARVGKEDDRMKEINLAFHFLLPRLKPEEKESNQEKNDPPTGFEEKSHPSSFFKEFLNIFERKREHHKRRTGQGAVMPERRARFHPGREKNTFRSDFSRIFNRACEGSAPPVKEKSKQGKQTPSQRERGISPSRPRTQGVVGSPYANFMKYMELKNRADSRARLRDPNDPGIVEKVSPVRRVSPVGRRQG